MIVFTVEMLMDEDLHEYPYKPKWTLIALGLAMFGVGAVVLGIKAANNDQGLVFGRLFEIEPPAATAFYWGLTLVSALFFGLALTFAYQRACLRQRLVLGPTELIVPDSMWSSRERAIPYRDIQELLPLNFNRQRVLHVIHPHGKFIIHAAMFPSRADFDEVHALLAAKVAQAGPETA